MRRKRRRKKKKSQYARAKAARQARWDEPCRGKGQDACLCGAVI
jgi:hypothetical protein